MIAFPPPPELGWYPEDAAWSRRKGIAMPVTAAAPAAVTPAAAAAPAVVAAVTPPNIVAPSAAVATAAAGERGVTDTDRTIIAPDAPIHRTPVSILRNTANGQEVPISTTILLGRKPSKNVPVGMSVAVLTDSTRTVSRNHAVVSVAADGSMTLRDLGSLNGTYVIDRGNEITVGPNEEVPFVVGVTLRIGDEFYAVEPGEPTKK